MEGKDDPVDHLLDDEFVDLDDDENEVWLPVRDIELSGYAISNQGRLKNVLTNRIMNNTEGFDGYIKNGIRISDGKCHDYRRHILVAKAFIWNPDNKPYVDHINGDIKDNRVSNLRWATVSENGFNKHVIPPPKSYMRAVEQLDPETGAVIEEWISVSAAANEMCTTPTKISMATRNGEVAFGYRWRYKETYIDGEEWRDVVKEGKEIGISNKGRIRLPMGKITFGSGDDGKYKSVSINEGKFHVHHLVCEAFNGLPTSTEQNTVNHKDKNPSNNCAENLEWASMREQALHRGAPKKGSKNICRHVLQLDPVTEKAIRRFPSLITAGKHVGVAPCRISTAASHEGVRGRKLAGGYKWSFINKADPYLIETMCELICPIKPVDQHGSVYRLDPSIDAPCERFDTIYEAAKKYNVNPSTISIAIAYNGYAVGCRWKEEDPMDPITHLDTGDYLLRLHNLTEKEREELQVELLLGEELPECMIGNVSIAEPMSRKQIDMFFEIHKDDTLACMIGNVSLEDDREHSDREDNILSSTGNIQVHDVPLELTEDLHYLDE